jgi:hypothetical protein
MVVGSGCHVKRFTTGGRRLADDEEVERPVCCGFRCTGKTMGQVYQCWWRICREIFFFRFEYHMFYVLYPFVTYLLTLPRMSQQQVHSYDVTYLLSCTEQWAL